MFDLNSLLTRASIRDASLCPHRALGFEDVGVMRRVGHKPDARHDVAWAQLDLTCAE